jgi:hypothetical protein
MSTAYQRRLMDGRSHVAMYAAVMLMAKSAN